jgi:hypothetical protein
MTFGGSKTVSDSETAELTLQERGIIATAASAAYLDHFSKADRSVISVCQSAVRRKRQYYSRGQEFLIEWQDYGQPLPAWFDPLVQGLIDLLTLPTNWDSYGAGSVELNLVQEAMNLMNGLLAPSSPAPRVVPLSSGGLQMEWHRNGIDLEIVFDRGEEPFFYSRNRVSGEEAEQSISGNDHLLRTIIVQLE